MSLQDQNAYFVYQYKSKEFQKVLARVLFVLLDRLIHEQYLWLFQYFFLSPMNMPSAKQL